MIFYFFQVSFGKCIKMNYIFRGTLHLTSLTDDAMPPVQITVIDLAYAQLGWMAKNPPKSRKKVWNWLIILQMLQFDIQGISLQSVLSNSALVRIYIWIFVNIGDPMCSWETPFFAYLTSFYWIDVARHLWSVLQKFLVP